jgi:hypothetical protein
VTGDGHFWSALILLLARDALQRHISVRFHAVPLDVSASALRSRGDVKIYNQTE